MRELFNSAVSVIYMPTLADTSLYMTGDIAIFWVVWCKASSVQKILLRLKLRQVHSDQLVAKSKVRTRRVVEPLFPSSASHPFRSLSQEQVRTDSEVAEIK